MKQISMKQISVRHSSLKSDSLKKSSLKNTSKKNSSEHKTKASLKNTGDKTKSNQSSSNKVLESSKAQHSSCDASLNLDSLIPKLKDSLLYQKSLILNNTHEFLDSNNCNVQLSDEAEVACNELSQNLTFHLHERNLNALMQIEKALNKISNKTYGQCESCADMIQIKRLQARPLAALCISCMEDLEEESKRINQ